MIARATRAGTADTAAIARLRERLRTLEAEEGTRHVSASASGSAGVVVERSAASGAPAAGFLVEAEPHSEERLITERGGLLFASMGVQAGAGLVQLDSPAAADASAAAAGIRGRVGTGAADAEARQEGRPELHRAERRQPPEMPAGGAEFDDDEYEYSDEGEEGEGEEEDVQSYLLFSSENWRWPSWLPRLHLEVVQRRSYDSGGGVDGSGGGGGGGAGVGAGGGAGLGAAPSAGSLTTEEELANLREVFPNVTEGRLRRVLLGSASLEAAIETLLDGLDSEM